MAAEQQDQLEKAVALLSKASKVVADDIKAASKVKPQPYYSKDYWDERHSYQALGYEWYQNYRSLRPVLTRVLPREGQILHVGVGTSLIQEQMLDDGYQSIINIDTSEVAIARLADEHSTKPQLSYQVGDVCSMHQFPSGSFSGILDKGTFDSLMCGLEAAKQRDPAVFDPDADDNADEEKPGQMLQECCRVLAPGAPLVLVSYGAPQSRLQYLASEQLDLKDVCFYCVATSVTTQDVHVVGPFRDIKQGMDASLFDEKDGVMRVDFIYIATKA